MAKQLTAKQKSELLALTPKDITNDKFIELFSDTAKVVDGKVVRVPSYMSPMDEFVLEKGEYFNKERVKTTAGQFIFNKFLIEEDFKDIIDYQLEVDGGVVKKIDSQLSAALLDDKITVEQMVKYLNKFQWLSKQHHTLIAGSFTMNTLKPNPKVQKRRDELLKKHEKELEQGDVVTAVKIEDELVDLAYNDIRTDHGLDMYDSGARGSFGNNHKNMVIMKGPVFNPITGKYDVVKSNFMEGIRKEELPIYGNSVVSGAYPKAVGTATSGYFSKQITAALQSVVLDSHGSDCKTKGKLNVKITKDNKGDFMYRYVESNKGITLLDASNIDSYVGKTVKMRSPMYCIGEKLCNKCAGELYYKLGIKNAGLTSSRASSTLLNLSMKKFHDSTAKIYDIDVNDIVI